MPESAIPRGIVPPGRYAKGGRSPIVYVLLCPPCAGYAPTTDEGYEGPLNGHCGGCGAWSREVHRFQAMILSAANGGCMCTAQHPQVTGDLPTEESAGAVMTEVRTRPPQRQPGAVLEMPHRDRAAAEPSRAPGQSGDEPWWCGCEDREGPHVHMSNWSAGPYGPMLTALVDLETGREIPGSRK